MTLFGEGIGLGRVGAEPNAAGGDGAAAPVDGDDGSKAGPCIGHVQDAFVGVVLGMVEDHGHGG